MKVRIVLIAACAAFLSSCVLTADAPLFSPADSDPALRLKEGLWVFRDDDCKVNPAKSSPSRKSCLEWMRIVRNADGSWMMSDLAEHDSARLTLVAAVPHKEGEPASVYAGELVSARDEKPTYAVFAPKQAPNGEVVALLYDSVFCTVTDAPYAPIDGIELTRDKESQTTDCKATSKEAVLEAVRRAALASLPAFGEHHIDFVRP